MTKYQIFDWAGNRIDRHEWPSYWQSFEEAEEDLSIFLNEDYDKNRGEYFIEQID